MVEFTAAIKRFAKQGEKTGWTYIEIPAGLAEELKPGNRRSFRVKGLLDQYPIKRIALLPLGGGAFIMAINATMRKGIGKKDGAMVKVKLEADESAYKIDKDFITCLQDEPAAREYFSALPKSHQEYFSKWIQTSKTIETKSKRITMSVNALARRMGFGEMLRENRMRQDR